MMHSPTNETPKKIKKIQKKIPTPETDLTEVQLLNSTKTGFERKSKIIRSPVLKGNFPLSSHQKEQSKETTPVIPNKENLQLVLENKLTKKTVHKEVVESQAKEQHERNYANVMERLNMFEKMCENLKKQVDDLTIENRRLKESLKNNDHVKNSSTERELPTTMEFNTDEEELALETEWTLNKNKKKPTKKRKAESSPELEPQRVTVLKLKQNEKAKNPKLPPVVLSNIDDFNSVQKIMSSQNIKYEIKLLNNNQLSIKVNSENDYRTLTKAVNQAKFEWHSYENKATRPCKVIARGLHPTCDPEYIVEDLKQLGFNILSAVNLKKKIKVNDKLTVKALPLFMLTFDHSEDIKKVFTIPYIVNTKVKIEAVRKQRGHIPQCKKCQRFEHTQAFCNREPRCVKCAGNHLTFDCKLDKKAPPKCSNCLEAHPANYRGCTVAKELQKRRLAKKKETVTKPIQQKIPTSRAVKGTLYSDVVKKSTSEAAFNNSPNPSHSNPGPYHSQSNKSKEDLIMTTLERLNSKIDEISARLEKIEGRYANKYIGTSRSILKK